MYAPISRVVVMHFLWTVLSPIHKCFLCALGGDFWASIPACPWFHTLGLACVCTWTQACYHDVLLALPKEVIPNLVNPLMLSDFLTDAFKIGALAGPCVAVLPAAVHRSRIASAAVVNTRLAWHGLPLCGMAGQVAWCPFCLSTACGC